MRPPDEVKLELVRQWLAKAEEDFGVAKHLIHENSPYFATVGFHAQQAAGEELKALLVWRQIEFPKTHDLDKLLDLVAVEENALAASLRDVSVLSRHGSPPLSHPVQRPDLQECQTLSARAPSLPPTIEWPKQAARRRSTS